jgi:hypothetical protein
MKSAKNTLLYEYDCGASLKESSTDKLIKYRNKSKAWIASKIHGPDKNAHEVGSKKFNKRLKYIHKAEKIVRGRTGIKEGSLGRKRLKRRSESDRATGNYEKASKSYFKFGYKTGEGSARARKNILKNRRGNKHQRAASYAFRGTEKVFNDVYAKRERGNFSRGHKKGFEVTKKLKEGSIGVRNKLKKREFKKSITKFNRGMKKGLRPLRGFANGAENKYVKALNMRNFVVDTDERRPVKKEVKRKVNDRRKVNEGSGGIKRLERKWKAPVKKYFRGKTNFYATDYNLVKRIDHKEKEGSNRTYLKKNKIKEGSGGLRRIEKNYLYNMKHNNPPLIKHKAYKRLEKKEKESSDRLKQNYEDLMRRRTIHLAKRNVKTKIKEGSGGVEHLQRKAESKSLERYNPTKSANMKSRLTDKLRSVAFKGAARFRGPKKTQHQLRGFSPKKLRRETVGQPETKHGDTPVARDTNNSDLAKNLKARGTIKKYKHKGKIRR